MNLKVIGTGSKGNAYILENKDEALLIECGVKFEEIKQGLDFNLGKVAGCLVTHEHKDHAKSMGNVMKAGINVHASKGTLEAKGLQNHHRAKPFLDYRNPVTIGWFNVLPFDVHHDATEPVGFLIYHEDCGNVLFLTDTNYCGYTFRNLNNIIVEANYDSRIAKRNLSEMEFLRSRIIQSHMSINTTIELLKANDLRNVNNIVLIHLSDSNSDEALFKREVKKATQKNVSVASNGMKIEFNKAPF